jgi:predicted MPP superfamily phosphohydrolase
VAHPRAHFDPKSGWFRRWERATSLFLSRHVWPHVPGASLPYDALLGRYLVVSEVSVPIAGLPAAFDGTTLLWVSDVHAGPFLSPRAVARAFARLAELSADVVIHGGDIATSNVRELLAHRDAVAGLGAPMGAFAVFGNHDHYTGDLPGVERFFASCGVQVLANDAVVLAKGGARIALAGIDDWNVGTPDLDAALAQAARVAPGAPIVLISHNPDAFFEAARRGVALVLSGHTHGGQVRLPGRPVLVRMSRYRLDEGRYEFAGAQIVVGSGLGVTGIPLRLYCPPEALLLTLRVDR